MCRGVVFSRQKIPTKTANISFSSLVYGDAYQHKTGMLLAITALNKLVTSPTQRNGQEQRKEQSKLMRKVMVILALALLVLSSAVVAGAQTPVTETPTVVTTTPTTVVTQTPTTVTKAVQNPDGTYTIIEYPVGKEVQLTLNPVALTNSKGVATILRDDNGTRPDSHRVNRRRWLDFARGRLEPNNRASSSGLGRHAFGEFREIPRHL